MNHRSPYDGKPYYCVKCGAGFAEFMACEEPDCEHEGTLDAEERAAKHADSTAQREAK